MNHKAKRTIEFLGLLKHPEGGYYKETYKSQEEVLAEHLPERFNGNRAFSTSIYFLITSDDYSAFHKLNQDEGWHFYDGSPVMIHMISPDGEYTHVHLGRNLERGQIPQFIVPAGCYFGASVIDKDSYSLVGCTVAPGFDFDDFELTPQKELLERFPQHTDIIMNLSKQ